MKRIEIGPDVVDGGLFPDMMWLPIRDGDRVARSAYLRHYSSAGGQAHLGRAGGKVVGPGYYTMLVTPDHLAVFCWRKFIDKCQPPQTGINNNIFRREEGCAWKASELIKEACRIAWDRWPGERLYTYINAKKIRGSNPGCCYLKAGWRRCGTTKGGLLILECIP